MAENELTFGDYCFIEQKRYRSKNEVYTYKVIGTSVSNYYRAVPVDGAKPEKTRGKLCPVVKVICCGVCEEEVETFRLCDVMTRSNPKEWFQTK